MSGTKCSIEKICVGADVTDGFAIVGEKLKIRRLKQKSSTGMVKRNNILNSRKKGCVFGMKKEVMVLTGAGQIGMAIARRMGYGKKIVMGDKNFENAKAIAEIMNHAGFDVEPVEMDLSSRKSILKLLDKALSYGEIKMLVNASREYLPHRHR